MPLFVFASAKGAPGTTTTLVGVAARWPTEGEVTLVEADPRGGDLAARFGLMPAPGLASAATDPQLTSDPTTLTGHAQPLPPATVATLLAPAQTGPAAAAVRAIITTAILPAAARTMPLLVDAGVLDAGSPVLPLCGDATLVLLSVRDRVEDLVHAAAAVDLLHGQGVTDLALLVRHAGGLPAARIGREFDLPVLAEVPTDPLGASVLCGRAIASPGWTRLRLPRTCAAIAKTLVARTPPADSAVMSPRVNAA